MFQRADRQIRPPFYWGLLAALAIFEAMWLWWYLVEPLPSGALVSGREAHRWTFLALTFPAVIPGVRLERSYLGMALEKLSHVENLYQRVPIVIASTYITAAILAFGRILLRATRLARVLDTQERAIVGFGLGAAALGVATLVVGRLGWLSPGLVRIALGLLIAAEVVLTAVGRLRPGDQRSRPVAGPKVHSGIRWGPIVGLLVIVAPFVLLMVLGAMLPPLDFDAIEYHLQGPKEYFQAGRIQFLPHNVYTSMPFSVEMLHLLGMEVMDDWWLGALAGQLLVASFAVWTAAAIALTARRLVSARAAWVATAVYLTTPWVYRLAVIPYVEGPLCFYHAATLWMASRALFSGGRTPNGDAEQPLGVSEPPTVNDREAVRLWILTGLLAGGAMGCKYPALVSAVIPFGMVALFDAARRSSWRVVVAYCLGWALIVSPWLGKNAIDTGNPVYPLGYKVFGGRYWNASQDQKWWKVHGARPVELRALGNSVLEVAGRSDWQSSLYVALAPLALLHRGTRRFALAVSGYAAYLFMTWWLLTHRLDRFWLPMLPALALLAGTGADWARGRAWSILLGLILTVGIATNLTYISTALAGFNEWTGDLRILRVKIPFLIDGPLARLDVEVPPGAKVLIVGQAGVFHVTHPILYNTVFDRELIEPITSGRSADEVRKALAELGVSYVYVDWQEIERHRLPGAYGYAAYIEPELFGRLVAMGVLAPSISVGPKHELYSVRKP